MGSLGDLPDPGTELESLASPTLQADSLPSEPPTAAAAAAAAAALLQSCPTLCDPIDGKEAPKLLWVILFLTNA